MPYQVYPSRLHLIILTLIGHFTLDPCTIKETFCKASDCIQVTFYVLDLQNMCCVLEGTGVATDTPLLRFIVNKPETRHS